MPSRNDLILCLDEDFKQLTVDDDDQSWFEPFMSTYEEAQQGIRKAIIPKYVFRTAGRRSAGINSCAGIKSGKYGDCLMKEIPTFENVGTSRHASFRSQEDIETEIKSHCHKHNRRLTSWISTTSSLLRALKILFVEHSGDGTIYMISTRECTIFNAGVLAKSLPGLADKSWNEYLVWGKIEEEAIVGWSTVDMLRGPSLDLIAHGISDSRHENCWPTMQQWGQDFITKLARFRLPSDERVNAAVQLASTFGSHDPSFIAERILRHGEFRIRFRFGDFYDWLEQQEWPVDEDMLRMREFLRFMSRAEESLRVSHVKLLKHHDELTADKDEDLFTSGGILHALEWVRAFVFDYTERGGMTLAEKGYRSVYLEERCYVVAEMMDSIHNMVASHHRYRGLSGNGLRK